MVHAAGAGAALTAALRRALASRGTRAILRLMRWQQEAEARVKKAPFFIRPFIKSRAEKEAKARGLQEVTTALLDELKSSEHRG